ncbi:Hypothetical predicted protein, partial [Mytilus galloprovincialis]
ISGSKEQPTRYRSDRKECKDFWKSRRQTLDKHWKEHPMIYNFDTEYTYNIGSSTSVVSDDEPEPNIEEQTDLLRLETLR